LNAETPTRDLRRRNSLVLDALPVVGAAVLMFAFLTLATPPPDNEADPSLSAVLHYGHAHGLQFGADLVSTYGPLGFLIFPYFSPHAAGLRIGVTLVLCYGVALGMCLLLRRLSGWARWVQPPIFIWMAANLEHRSDLVFDVGLLCWGLLCFVESGRWLALSGTVFTGLAVFGALAKTSFLFTAGASVMLVAFALRSRGNARLAAGMAAGGIAGFVLGWIIAGQNVSHLGRFLTTAFAVVQGYNAAQGWEALELGRRWGFILAFLTLMLMVVRVWKLSPGSAGVSSASQGEPASKTPALPKVRITLLLWLVFLTFTVWKHGFVRGDVYHAVFFFTFVPVLALGVDALPCEGRVARCWACALSLACCVIALATLQFSFFPPIRHSLVRPFEVMAENFRNLFAPVDYLRRMNETIAVNRTAAQLPVLRQTVGRSSVDLFGDSQAFAIYNELSYQPRPAFQAYAACNAELMELNEEFFLTRKAPRFVLFELGAADRKFPPLEDARVLRALLMNYTLVTNENRFLLLESNACVAPKLKLVHEGTVRTGERIEINAVGETPANPGRGNTASSAVWLQIEMTPSLAGRLRQFLYRPPTVRLAAWREAGKKLILRRRAPASMLAAGFLASPLVSTTEDVRNLYTGKPSTRPAAYSVELLPGEEYLWKPKVKFRLYTIEPKS
jgi:hypothetical protein